MLVEAYLGLDLGGTGAKAGVFDREGRPLALAHRPYSTQISDDGRAELTVETIDRAAREVVQEASSRSGARILGMSVSSQGQTFVTLDNEGRALHGAIAWFDSRATEEAALIRKRLDERELRGLDLSPISSAPKILWLKKNYPRAMERAAKFLFLPDYFTYRLTGRAVCDPAMAGTTGLYSRVEDRYCESALQELCVSSSAICHGVSTQESPLDILTLTGGG